MNSLRLIVAMVWMAQVALAQTPPDEPAPPVPDVLTPPPMPPPEPDRSVVLQPSKVANAPLAPEQPPTAAPEEDTTGRLTRLGLGALGAAVVGTGVGLGLGFAVPGPSVSPLGPRWTMGAVGFAVGAPVGLLVAQWLLGGKGAWWAAIAGDVLGFALGGLVSWATGGPEGIPLAFVLPLAGALLGYELSSP